MSTDTEPRTDEDKVLQNPVSVTLGGEKYEIKPLPILKANKWRREFITLMQDISSLASVTSDDKDAFSKALSSILIDKPEKLVDLLFEYAVDLPRETIENSASSIEILNAIEEVIGLESPFLGAAVRVTNAARKHLV